MNGMIVPSVSAGSSHRAARDTCTPHVMTPSGAAWSGRAGARRRHASATSAARLREGKPVQPRRVLSNDLPPFFLRDPFEVTLDDLARVRPGRHRVGIIGGPHDVLDPDELAVRHTDPIVDEGRKDLASEVFRGRKLQLGRIEVAIFFLGWIEVLQEKRKPTDFILG